MKPRISPTAITSSQRRNSALLPSHMLRYGLTLIFLLGSSAFAVGLEPPSALWLPVPPAQLVLREGTGFHIVLETPVDSAHNPVGTPVSGLLQTDVFLDNKLILPRHTRFEGQVSRVDPPIHGANAVLGLQFNRMTFANGTQFPITAHVKTYRPDHVWGGELTPGTEPQVVTHHVTDIGAYNQTILGGVRLMGTHVELPPGEVLTLVLDKQLALPVYPACDGSLGNISPRCRPKW